MIRRLAFLTLLGGALISATAAAAAGPEHPNRAVAGLPNPYQLTPGWGGGLPNGRAWGNSAAVAVDTDGKHIWAIDRCGSTSCVGSNLDMLIRFSPEGKVVATIGGGKVTGPHGIHVDREGNIWVTDIHGPRRYYNGRTYVEDPTAPAKGFQVHKFAPDGRLLMSLGESGVQGLDGSHFYSPTDVITAPNGDIFVSDGHLGAIPYTSRIVKFDKTGKFIKAFGAMGDGSGQLFFPHALAMDSQGRLFVADRSNHRIVIFSQDGVQLAEWRQFGRPSDIAITADDKIYVTDSESGIAGYNLAGVRGITIGDARTGAVTAFIPDASAKHITTAAEAAPLAEGLAVDAAGNIYGAVVNQRPTNLLVWRPTGARR